MARVRSPNRDKAFEIYKEHNGSITNREIASILNISEKTVSGWKCKDNWDNKSNGVLQKKIRSTPNKKGGQPNNKNAIGHGAPPENKNAETHGFFSKYLPKDTFDIIKEMDEDPSKILWQNIQIQYAAIVRAQNIMLVESKSDITKELAGETNGDTSSSERYNIQFAWDKQASFLKAQSRAMSELRLLIKQFEVTASEEQKMKVKKMEAELNKIAGTNNNKSHGNMDKLIEVFNKGPVIE
ncbi:MAG: phage terminase small subunit [Clostridium neonatale]